MPGTLSLESIPSQSPPPHRKWTRTECRLLEEQGIFAGQRFELVEGDLVTKRGHNPAHAYAVRMLTAMLAIWFGDRAAVRLSLIVNELNEPEPDALVTFGRAEEFARRLPEARDVAWVIEVSDSTLKYDLTVKASLYASARLEDYWVIDLVNRRIIVHREPAGGRYLSVSVFQDNERVAPLTAPDRSVCFADFAA
jgi:Uma2 family endonuclease